MATEFGESTSQPSASSSSNGNNNSNDASDFECNICFDLAHYPIVTLCGHLFCWPCLHRWLLLHSQSHECPVCKALVQEDKLLPIYGRGKTPCDPRSRPVPGVDIPNRPHGQRPEPAHPRPRPHPNPPQPPVQNYFSNLGFGFLGGFLPFASANFGNMSMAAGFGGLFPSFNFQFHGFPDAAMYGATHGFPFGYAHTFHTGHNYQGRGGGVSGPRRYQRNQNQGQDSFLKSLLILIGLFVLLSLFWS